MKLKVSALIFTLLTSNLFCQIITNYQQTNNQILCELNLRPVKNYKKHNGNKTLVVFNDYLDISNPGTFALPSKEIIISLPSYSKIKAELSNIVLNKINGSPVVNPSLKVNGNGNFEYFNESQKYSSHQRDYLEILGYFWIRDYYCVKIRINQYQYNNDIIEELSKAKLKITLLSIEKNSEVRISQSASEKEYLSQIIDNFVNAVTLDKQIYEPSAINNFSWIDFNKTYLKLGVNKDGIYRIRKADLVSFGIDVSKIPSNTYKLFYKGKELPIYIENQGTYLEGEGYIEFVGRKNWGENYREVSSSGMGYNEYLNRYSDTSIYWLTWGGENGLRIDTVSNFIGIPQDTLFSYNELLHFEENIWFDYSFEDLARRQLPQWKDNQTWVWGQQQVGTNNNNFAISELYPNKIAKAYYKVQDFASNIFSNAHKVGLKINNDNIVYDSSFFNKYQQRVISAEFNSNLLQNGNNSLYSISFPTTATQNSILVDWYEIEYPRYLKPYNDSLKFCINDLSDKSLKYFKISNLTDKNVLLYKISNQIKKITNIEFVSGSDGFDLFFVDSVNKGDTYLLIKDSKVLSPNFIYKKQFSNIVDNKIQADYILLTNKAFLQKAEEYTNFISQNYNISTKAIDVNDIYDQFNYGFFAPEPIKDFLITANELWQAPKPMYLFIVGDATYDFYNNKNKYFKSPKIYNIVPSYGEPVSDTWYTIWDNGSFIPQMFVGRLPAGNIDEFNYFFEKHKKYVSQPYDDWNKYYLFFSGGDGSDSIQINNLKSVNDTIIKNIINPAPVSGIANSLYKTFNPLRNFGPYSPEEINKIIGKGGVFTCYVGHSATQVWDNGITDPSQLHNNQGKFTLMSDFGCSTARFAEPDIKSFAELFVNGLKGEAIGYTGNSSLGFLTPLPDLYYEELLKNNVLEIGKAHTLAKTLLLSKYGRSTVNQVILYSNHLISDPIIKLKVPQLPNLTASLKDIHTDKKLLDDSIDSVSIKLVFYNFGMNTSAPFSIEISHLVNGIEIGKIFLNKIVPAFKDSIVLKLPLKGAVGNHTLVFNIDNLNQVDEIYENDNQLSYTFNVASNAARILANEYTDNLNNGELRVINPVTMINPDSLKIETSASSDFAFSSVLFKKPDTVYTKIQLNHLNIGKRYWVRSKLNNLTSEFGTAYSFIYDSSAIKSYYLGDTISYNNKYSEGLKINALGIKLTEFNKYLKIISAGYNDGAFAVIEINGNNYLPAGYLGGIHIAVFNDSTLEFLYTRRFSNWDHPNFVSDLNSFLDSIPSNKLACFAFSSDAGLGIPDSVKSKIKTFGSVYIDSLTLYDSWAMIGKKGAAPGSVPEKFSHKFDGNVTVDTTFIINKNNGLFITSEYGPVKKWKSIKSDYSTYPGSNIVFTPIGIKSDGTKDTLQALNFQNGIADAAYLNPYKKISLLVNFSRSNSSEPTVKNIRIDYDPLDELGTNYEVVSVPIDTVLIGENLSIKYRVYNEGFNETDSIKVKLERIKADNTKEVISESIIPTLKQDTYKEFNSVYNTSSGAGNGSFLITIDPENLKEEYYKDNNVYSIPFYVKPDTSHPNVKVTFNGVDIIDGDYISANPLIKVELNDPSLLPITDTTSFMLKLNDERIYFLNNNDLKISYNSNNPKAIVEYTPKLKGGEYEFSVIGKNSTGNLSDSMGVVKRFLVADNMKLLDVFNYPNPFKESTWFTFKLTKIPDEIKIKVFTIAGRLVKEFNKKSSELKFDFNRIFWDGKDEDGDKLANGIYIYKIISTVGDKTETAISKAAIIR